jgi:hypothetical protein
MYLPGLVVTPFSLATFHRRLGVGAIKGDVLNCLRPFQFGRKRLDGAADF